MNFDLNEIVKIKCVILRRKFAFNLFSVCIRPIRGLPNARRRREVTSTHRENL